MGEVETENTTVYFVERSGSVDNNMLILWLLAVLSVLIHWLYKVNKDYYILSFFARRARTKDGRSVESLVPTPKSRTIFGNCFDCIGKDNAEVFQFFRDQAVRYGECYLHYTPGKASFNVIDAPTVENILNHPKLINKGFMYDFLHPFLKTGVLTAKEKKWHTRRGMLQRTFHYNILNQFQEIFIAESLKFVEQFKGKESCIVSLRDPIYRFTLNSICETAMGVKLDEMGDSGSHYRDNLHHIDEGFVRRIKNPLYWGDFWYNLFAARDYAAALKQVHGFSSDIIAKRRILLEEELENRRLNQSADDDIGFTSKKPFAMLDTLICAEKDGLIDHKGICEEVDTLIYEGYDSPFHVIKFGLMNMSLYPDHQENCYREVQELIKDDLSNLDTRQLNNLKNLDCFLKETMRLFPSGPILARQAIEETELANGLILPKGSHINIHIFDIHRNPKHWDSPEEFRPDRFLTENCQWRHPYAYIPFSAGSRNCLGKKFAMQEVKTLLVVILKHFKIVPITNPEPIVFQMGIQLRTTNTLKVKFVKRT